MLSARLDVRQRFAPGFGDRASGDSTRPTLFGRGACTALLPGRRSESVPDRALPARSITFISSCCLLKRFLILPEGAFSACGQQICVWDCGMAQVVIIG